MSAFSAEELAYLHGERRLARRPARAVEAGVDGVIVSNHGGRQVDGSVAALDALPEVVDAAPDEFPVLFDSGIRSGSDIFSSSPGRIGRRLAATAAPCIQRRSGM